MIKILKNTTNEIIKIRSIGQQVLALGQLNVPPDDFDNLSQDSELLDKIDSGEIIVNDGSEDLSVALSKKHITDNIAKNIGFDNSSNGFTAIETQSAIEEVKNNRIVGGASGTIVFFKDSGADDKWFSLFEHHLATSNSIPFICPFDLKIVAVTLVSGKDNKGGDVEIYKNGITVNEKIYTLQVRNKRWLYQTTGLSALTFSQGDSVALFNRKVSGQSQMDDVIIHLYFAFTADSMGNGGGTSGFPEGDGGGT